MLSGIDAQENLPEVIPSISRETLVKLNELIFPLDKLKYRENDYVIILRYSPSFENNSQIVIVGRDGKAFVTEYTVNVNLWQKATEILKSTGREDPTEIAKAITVRKREFEIPFGLSRQWSENLLESVVNDIKPKKFEPNKSNVTTITLDGTVYELWYSSGAGELRYLEYGSEVNKRIFSDESSFIRWMKIINREISKRQ